MTNTRRADAWLILCLIVQSVLLTNSLGLLPMWNDELFTVRAARLPVDAMLDLVRGDVHPPLYFLLAHYWIQIAPAGETLAHYLMKLIRGVPAEELQAVDKPRLCTRS